MVAVTMGLLMGLWGEYQARRARGAGTGVVP